jgi:pimeloyl-ACP methyl ester carboxylesterase
MIRTCNVTVNGVRSLVRESGPQGAREAVVFVHGNPGSGEDWSDLLEAVGGLARAVAPDMPGYGKADRPTEFDYTVEGYARHLAGVLEQIGVSRAHLVLHDFGGPWGLAWAAAHQDAVASLCLVNIGVVPDYRWHTYARIWRTPLLGELFVLTVTRGLFRLLLDAENPKPFPRAFADRMFDDLDAGTKRAILRLYRATPDLGALTVRLAERLEPLNLPALVMWGAADRNLPVRYAREQRRYFPTAEVHELDGCGHWPFIDDVSRVRALLVPFLREQLAGSRRDAPERA